MVALSKLLAAGHVAACWQLSSPQMRGCTPEQQCHGPGMLAGAPGRKPCYTQRNGRGSLLSALASLCCAWRNESFSRPCFPVVEISRNVVLFMCTPPRNNPLGNIGSVLRALLNMGERAISPFWQCLSKKLE